MKGIDALKKLLLPPLAFFWLAFLGLALVAAGATVAGTALAAGAVGGLYLLALPGVAGWLLERLDRWPPLDPERLDVDAVVVLDAGRRLGAREYGGDGVRAMTLERLAYAAWLWRRRELPIAVTGNGAGPLMADVLADVFGVPVAWIEPESHNTHENAAATARLLRADGVERAALVTHFWHMPRAAAAFAGTGLAVTPAPMGYRRRRDSWERGVFSLAPTVEALERSHLAIHEGIGLAWYRIRYGHRGAAP